MMLVTSKHVFKIKTCRNLFKKIYFVVEEIFELGNATKYRCLGVRVEAQANGKEPWINERLTSDRGYSDWQRTLSDD